MCVITYGLPIIINHDNNNTYFEYIICINKTYICLSWNSCLWWWWSWSWSLSFIHLTLTLREIDSQCNRQYSVYNYRKRNVKCYFKAGFNLLNNKSWECKVYSIFSDVTRFCEFCHLPIGESITNYKTYKQQDLIK